MVIHIFVIFSVDHPSFFKDPLKSSLHVATATIAILAVINRLGDVIFAVALHSFIRVFGSGICHVRKSQIWYDEYCKKKSHMSLGQLFIFGIQNEYGLYAEPQAMVMTVDNTNIDYFTPFPVSRNKLFVYTWNVCYRIG